jgi:16S rRNA (cytosine967-C5)-methyltransferase
MMQGKGRLIATDHDKRQLAPIYERLSRAGVHNAEIRAPKGDADPLADIRLRRSRADRRALHRHRHLAPQPDAKWRMRPGALEVRLKDQAEVLDRAAALVKPGGRIAYVTCSVLPAKTASRSAPSSRAIRSFRCQPPDETASVLWDKAEDFEKAALQSPKAG